MKKNYRLVFLSIIFFISIVKVMGQPVLTAADINPVIGDQFRMIIDFVSPSPGNPGPNQTWDLTSIGANILDTFYVVSAFSTPYSATFLNANIALKDGAGTVYNYYGTSSTLLQFHGYYSGTANVYSNPEDFLRFPFTYNDGYNDTWQDTYRTGITTVFADGYGTLKTPAGTFNNILRVHYVGHYTTATDTVTEDSYAWYSKNNHFSIAGTSEITYSSGGSSNSAYYIDNAVAGNEESDLMSSFSLSPNPAVDYLDVNLNLLSKQEIEIKVYNSLGSLVTIPSSLKGVQGNNCYRMDLAGVSEGIYFVQLLLDDKLTATRRFVIGR